MMQISNVPVLIAFFLRSYNYPQMLSEMSGADRQSQPAPPSADQLRMFLQSMQQIQPNNTVTPKPGNTASDKQSPSLEDNKVFEMLINNPEYQRMINYSQMSQAAAQSVPIQHPLSAAASNPDNPAFRALMNGTNMPGFSHEIYPNFVPVSFEPFYIALFLRKCIPEYWQLISTMLMECHLLRILAE
jgi:hypothetical protein